MVASSLFRFSQVRGSKIWRYTFRMSISVVMPVYNSEKTLRQAVSSVLWQSYKDFEFIIVDDGSTDASSQILKGYEEMDQRVKVITNTRNLGVVRSLNVGFAQARFPYVARMDADDESLLERFALQKQFLDQNPEIGVVGGSYYIMGRSPSKDLLIHSPTDPAKVQEILTHDNPICHPTAMVRKSVFDEVGGYRQFFINSEDFDLWLRISRKTTLSNLAQPILRYRLSPDGVTLKRRWEMYLYYRVALESFADPTRPLEEVRNRVENELQELNKNQILKYMYRNTSRQMWSLGFPWMALTMQFRMAREIGFYQAFVRA